MTKLQYSVSGGILELPSGKCLEVGLASWWDWLESEDAKSFRFETDHGCKSYTARKEAIKTGVFWYAYKKIESKLHKSYIGKSDELSLERLESVAYKLLEPSKPRSTIELPKKSLGNSEAGELVETIEQMRRNAFQRESDFDRLLEQKIRLEKELKELHTSIGNQQDLEARLKECQHRCIHLENENRRLEKLGQDYSQATVARLSNKYNKALKDVEDWKETAEGYKRQAMKLKVELDRLQALQEQPDLATIHELYIQYARETYKKNSSRFTTESRDWKHFNALLGEEFQSWLHTLIGNQAGC